uniref:Uncharacterized protein n=1 Tax=Leersia perrieri TaxID=77586 RepID=A0A0D9Y0G7_9ORYZ
MLRHNAARLRDGRGRGPRGSGRKKLLPRRPIWEEKKRPSCSLNPTFPLLFSSIGSASLTAAPAQARTQHSINHRPTKERSDQAVKPATR